MVKRYDCDVCYDVGMTAHVSGDWVSYSDYATLIKERDALAAELEASGKLIDTLRQDKDKVIDMSIERVNKLLSRAEATEKRITELEARTVTLPDVEKWRSVDAVRAQSAYKVLVSKVLAVAGIGVKGE